VLGIDDARESIEDVLFVALVEPSHHEVDLVGSSPKDLSSLLGGASLPRHLDGAGQEGMEMVEGGEHRSLGAYDGSDVGQESDREGSCSTIERRLQGSSLCVMQGSEWRLEREHAIGEDARESQYGLSRIDDRIVPVAEIQSLHEAVGVQYVEEVVE